MIGCRFKTLLLKFIGVDKLLRKPSCPKKAKTKTKTNTIQATKDH